MKDYLPFNLILKYHSSVLPWLMQGTDVKIVRKISFMVGFSIWHYTFFLLFLFLQILRLSRHGLLPNDFLIHQCCQMQSIHQYFLHIQNDRLSEATHRISDCFFLIYTFWHANWGIFLPNKTLFIHFDASFNLDAELMQIILVLNFIDEIFHVRIRILSFYLFGNFDFQTLSILFLTFGNCFWLQRLFRGLIKVRRAQRVYFWSVFFFWLTCCAVSHFFIKVIKLLYNLY